MGGSLQGKRLSLYPHPASPAVSAVMRANKKRDTGPERRLRSTLHAQGLRFRKNLEVQVTGLKVRPDIVFTARRLAVFVDGCFWHSCRWHGTRPRRNTHYWLPKLKRVAARDLMVKRVLTRSGWRVLRVWEHVPTDRAADLVRKALMVR